MHVDASRRLDVTAAAISTLADHGAGVALLVGIDAWRRQRSWRNVATRLAVVGIPIVATNTLTKRLIDRPRPDGATTAAVPVRRPVSSSFPSGHTLAATAAAVALPDSPSGQIAGLIGAGIVGWSRLRLQAHHVSDVLGGVVIGGLLGLLLRRALDVIGRE